MDFHERAQQMKRNLTSSGGVDVVLKRIQMDIMKETQLNFRNNVDPNGVPWKMITPYTFSHRRQGRNITRTTTGTIENIQILADSGVLKNSITRANHEKHFEKIEIISNFIKVSVGTNVAYAPYHNSDKPRHRLPRRQFLGFNARMLTLYKKWLLAQALKGTH